MSEKERKFENSQNIHQPESTISLCPAGKSFQLPNEEDYDKEFKRLQKLVQEQRLMGREIVVVVGVGFVGAVMAGVIADSVDHNNSEPTKFVIGMQRPSTRSYWKIHYINRGIPPVEAEDPEVAPLIRRCVKEKKTLTATYTYDALTLADVVVVDVQCDYYKETLGDVKQGRADIDVVRGAHKASLLSPVSGVVTAVNAKLREKGDVAGQDPYSEGWVTTIHTKTFRQDLKNLMIHTESAEFMEREVAHLYQVIEETAGPLAADGGHLGHNIYGHMPELGWERLVKSFLRT